MAKNKVKIVDRGTEEFKKSLRPATILRAGIISPEAEQPSVHGMAIGELAIKHEMGIDTPERPWLRGWFDAVRSQILVDLYAAVADAFKNNELANGAEKMRVNLAKLGAEYAEAMQLSIRSRDADLLPNAPYTIAQKGSDVPLIETGQLVRSIRHEVEQK